MANKSKYFHSSLCSRKGPDNYIQLLTVFYFISAGNAEVQTG